MDENNIQISLKERFQKLPPNLQQAIISTDTQKVFQEITTKYRLHIDQAGELENETMIVLFGAEKPTNFLANIQSALNISQTMASQIVNDINQGIFLKIREGLRQVHNEPAPITGPTQNDNKNQEWNSRPREYMTIETAPVAPNKTEDVLNRQTLLNEIETASITTPVSPLKTSYQTFADNKRTQQNPRTPGIPERYSNPQERRLPPLPPKPPLVGNNSPVPNQNQNRQQAPAVQHAPQKNPNNVAFRFNPNRMQPVQLNDAGEIETPIPQKPSLNDVIKQAQPNTSPQTIPSPSIPPQNFQQPRNPLPNTPPTNFQPTHTFLPNTPPANLPGAREPEKPVPQKLETPPPKPPEKYTVDPYREAI
jgi:hypothetical protein